MTGTTHQLNLIEGANGETVRVTVNDSPELTPDHLTEVELGPRQESDTLHKFVGGSISLQRGEIGTVLASLQAHESLIAV